MSLLPIRIAATVFALAARTAFVRLRTLSREAGQDWTQYHDSLAETAGGLVLRCDRSGSVTSVSANCQSLLGLPPAALQGRGFFERVQVADRPAFLKTLSDACAGAGSSTATATLRWRGRLHLRRGDYAEPVFQWLEMRARSGADGKRGTGSWPGEAIAVFRDVTEAKRREAELEDARAAAEEANLCKEQFLAHAGHELRTPLNAIIGFAELLGDSQPAQSGLDKQRDYARIIHQSGQHLLDVVDSILNMSKIQSGSVAVEHEPFAVAPLIDLCCDMVKLRAEKNRVQLLRAYPEKLDEITGDKRICTQILINLLSNAIKFTPPTGSVTVSARPDSYCLLIQVADTGIGIAEDDLARLGDPFFQANAVPDPHEKGAGLGLSIVRGLVGLQGGTIMVASEPGKGTCVHVRLPLDCRHLAAKVKIPAKIETIARLPFDQDDFPRKMMVRKIA